MAYFYIEKIGSDTCCYQIQIQCKFIPLLGNLLDFLDLE